MRRLCLLLLLGIMAVAVHASGEDDIVKANKAYSAGSFAVAAETYRKVAEAGYEAPELFYNLGNSYFKMNDFPHAILWYERARRLDPGNEDISFNLNVASTKISDKIEPLPELFYKKWFGAIIQLFSVDTWARIGICLFIGSLLCGLIYIVSRVLFLRKLGFWLASGMFILSVVTLSLAWSGYSVSKSTAEAIIFAPTITVKSSPDDKGTDLFVVHEGTKVRLLDNISGWYEIRIANGSVGWLPESSLEKI
jgi:tetratricopeptide (TPR) repeat protein